MYTQSFNTSEAPELKAVAQAASGADEALQSHFDAVIAALYDADVCVGPPLPGGKAQTKQIQRRSSQLAGVFLSSSLYEVYSIASPHLLQNFAGERKF